ncbi:Cys-tRNA(Pro) deacylase [Fusibacter bizertensis]
MKKTNVERILDQQKLIYEVIHYEVTDGKIDGVSVADKIGKNPNEVFKTLVTVGHSRALYVFLIPVSESLDMKKAAKACGEKSVEMLAVKDIEKYTGYIRGGCSPIGMKKKYRTFIHESIENADYITVSAGKIGAQIRLNPEKLAQVTEAVFVDLIQKG